MGNKLISAGRTSGMLHAVVRLLWPSGLQALRPSGTLLKCICQWLFVTIYEAAFSKTHSSRLDRAQCYLRPRHEWEISEINLYVLNETSESRRDVTHKSDWTHALSPRNMWCSFHTKFERCTLVHGSRF